VERARREATQRGTRPRAAAGMPRVQAPRGQPRVRAGPGRRLVHHAECWGRKTCAVCVSRRIVILSARYTSLLYSSVARTRQMAAVQRLALRLALSPSPTRLRRLLSSAVRYPVRWCGRHIRSGTPVDVVHSPIPLPPRSYNLPAQSRHAVTPPTIHPTPCRPLPRPRARGRPSARRSRRPRRARSTGAQTGRCPRPPSAPLPPPPRAPRRRRTRRPTLR
jgi:hypothetical protein